jgi:hypothetical protein
MPAKNERTIPKIAHDHATILIAKYGIEKAELIAKLTFQKVKAQRVKHEA